MNPCPKCKKPVADGAEKCPSCGVMLVVPDVIDLMPEDPPAKPAAGDFAPPEVDPFAPPPDAPGKPRSKFDRAQRKEPLAGRGAAGKPKANPTVRLVTLSVPILLVGLVVWLLVRPVTKVHGDETSMDLTLNMLVNNTRTGNYQIEGTAQYTMVVSPQDGDVEAAFYARDKKDRIVEDKLQTVKKGESRTLSGKVGNGSYSWVLRNPTKAPVKVKLKFDLEY